jgi:hypothetical protein
MGVSDEEDSGGRIAPTEVGDSIAVELWGVWL